MDPVYSPHPCIKGFLPISFLFTFFLYSDWTEILLSLHPLSDLSLFYSNFSRVDFLVIYTTLLLISINLSFDFPKKMCSCLGTNQSNNKMNPDTIFQYKHSLLFSTFSIIKYSHPFLLWCVPSLAD